MEEQAGIEWVAEGPDFSDWGGEIIRPTDLRTNDHLCTVGQFGCLRAEQAAGRLLQFFKGKARWAPFALSELKEYYKAMGWDTSRMLYGLTGPYVLDTESEDKKPKLYMIEPCLAAMPDGSFCILSTFIERCQKTPVRAAA